MNNKSIWNFFSIKLNTDRTTTAWGITLVFLNSDHNSQHRSRKILFFKTLMFDLFFGSTENNRGIWKVVVKCICFSTLLLQTLKYALYYLNLCFTNKYFKVNISKMCISSHYVLCCR